VIQVGDGDGDCPQSDWGLIARVKEARGHS